MTIGFRAMALPVIMSLELIGCQSVSNDCSTFPKIISDANDAGVVLRGQGENLAIKKSVDTINSCAESGSVSYLHNKKISLKKVSLGSDEKYYLFYSIYGTLDNLLAFQVGKSGEVESAFYYSPLSRFAAPN